MKPKFRHLRHLALIGSFVVSGTAAVAATGTWNYGSTTAANLSWGYSNATTPSWTSNIIPNAVGDIADFSVLNITAAKAITLDADRTIGTLKIGDSGSSYFAYTFNSGTPTTSRLIFDQTGVANASMVLATAATAASTAANVINTGILLKDNLVIDSYQTSASTIALAMNGVIDDGSGSFSITKNGPSIISMSAANTYDGGTTITGGRITAANASSFGTGQVTVNGSGQAYLSSSLTYANNFSIAGNGFTETAGNLGAIRYSGATTSGSLNVAADARIVAYTAATGTLNGALTGTAALEINGSTASFNGTFNLNGSAAGYSGALTVSQGRLNLATTTNPGGSLSVKDGAILSGETSVNGALTLGNSGSTTTGPTLYIDASTADTLHTNGNLILNGKTTVALTGAVSGSSVPVLSYSGALTGNATNLDLMGGLAGYRPGTGFDFSVANQINLTLITGNVTWTGAATSAWNTTDVNWFDGTSSTTFYNLDSITFDESHSGKATYTTNLTNAANNDLVFTAVASGAAGEAVMIQYLDPFTPSSPLSVSVAGSVINVSLATDALGAGCDHRQRPCQRSDKRGPRRRQRRQRVGYRPSLQFPGHDQSGNHHRLRPDGVAGKHDLQPQRHRLLGGRHRRDRWWRQSDQNRQRLAHPHDCQHLCRGLDAERRTPPNRQQHRARGGRRRLERRPTFVGRHHRPHSDKRLRPERFVPVGRRH